VKSLIQVGLHSCRTGFAEFEILGSLGVHRIPRHSRFRVSRFLKFPPAFRSWVIVCHPKQGSFWIHYSARSFAIYNPKERKPEFRRAARRRNGKSRGNEICRDEKKKKSAESSPFLSVSLSPSRAFVCYGRRGKSETRSLAPNKRRKFQRPASRESYLIERGKCKRAAFLQPRVDSGFISEERRPVEESSRGVPGRSLRDGNGIAVISGLFKYRGQ